MREHMQAHDGYMRIWIQDIYYFRFHSLNFSYFGKRKTNAKSSLSFYMCDSGVMLFGI